jgi:kynurenine formamidase
MHGEQGALIVASWPKPLGGSGFPARVIAIHQAHTVPNPPAG